VTLAAAYPPATRWAWLDLYGDGTVTVPVENYAAGYFCSNLDLGAPAVRAVVTNRPDTDGEDDRTQYFAGRVVTINISAFAGAGAQIDAVPSLFGKFMAPSARPVLHFVLNRPGVAERTLTLRPSTFAWPISNPSQRDVQLVFEAADPIIRDVATQSATSWSGSTGGGRAYPLTFPRTYPAGGSQANATISSVGDVAVRPLLRIYGPITTPVVTFSPTSGTAQVFAFVSGYQIQSGHFVAVDALNRTATLDGLATQSVLGSIDWSRSTWPALAPAPITWTMVLQGDATGLVTSGLTQVQATWHDGYLT
jgi:hypothetical protein